MMPESCEIIIIMKPPIIVPIGIYNRRRTAKILHNFYSDFDGLKIQAARSLQYRLGSPQRQI